MALEDEDDKNQQQKRDAIITSKSFHQSVPKLPTEIIVDILLRLPIQSLLRCKSVCKLWCSLISDTQFVKSHLSSSISNNHYAHHRLLFSTRPGIIFKTCHLYDLLYDNPICIDASEFDYSWKHTHRNARIVGSCNGLLCIAIERDALFIWNPSTRKLIRLDRPCDLNVVYGFGYDKCTDDYKVVEISCLVEGIEKCETFIAVYSLKNRNWKKFGVFPNGVTVECGKFVSGALHWLVWKGVGSSYGWTIISLDMAKETYGEVSQPVYDEGNYMLFTLGALKEWLCVSCEYRDMRVDLWVMKIYGVKDSWTKLVSIPYNGIKTHNRWSPCLVPLWIVNDGKILLTFGYKVIVYDTKSSSYSEVEDIDECVEACTFVESLVSPHSPNTTGD